ncbi:DNA-binding protein P3A2-like isoform X2 [Ischnura elegans]|uniref:DNA-binding protein P3A2-like isoform X2 n=1 Tax=Ischnura elegans TaxID=197161 RepID=UPI001ED89BCF|nr:DNA-binding protein P3A2-like isoform X2 [Ischnura elegans]
MVTMNGSGGNPGGGGVEGGIPVTELMVVKAENGQGTAIMTPVVTVTKGDDGQSVGVATTATILTPVSTNHVVVSSTSSVVHGPVSTVVGTSTQQLQHHQVHQQNQRQAIHADEDEDEGGEEVRSGGEGVGVVMRVGGGDDGTRGIVECDDDDDDDEEEEEEEDEEACPSSAESPAYEEDDGDLMAAAMGDEVTAQLAAAGPVGVAAAAAIASAKKRKRPHSFETNPSFRKRQQNRLLRKLRQTIDEFATRVGQQAVVVVATPGKPQNSFKVFGAKPLEDVVKNLRSVVMQELETALAQQAPPPPQEDPSLYELPPLIIDGIPTPVEKMTQAQLRAFIPLMLKYSTGRGKPGWGKESTRPPWWPKELPWANVRMDARSEEEKQKMSWTHALRQIVVNCYKYHGREDLLPVFSEEDEASLAAAGASIISNPKGVVVAGPAAGSIVTTEGAMLTKVSHKVNPNHIHQVAPQYASTMLQTISNPDGTVSIIQVDPNNPIITLPDGTTAQVQGVATIHTSQSDGTPTVHAVQTLAEVAAAAGGGGDGTTGVAVDLNNVTEATLGQDGQIILTGEDGHGYPVSVSGMITVPVTPSMYQTVVANIQQIHSQGDGATMQVIAVGGPGEGTGAGGAVVVGDQQQVLQVLSIKDASTLLASAAAAARAATVEVKDEVSEVLGD